MVGGTKEILTSDLLLAWAAPLGLGGLSAPLAVWFSLAARGCQLDLERARRAFISHSLALGAGFRQFSVDFSDRVFHGVHRPGAIVGGGSLPIDDGGLYVGQYRLW